MKARNSQSAQEYAAKKRAAMEKAARLREAKRSSSHPTSDPSYYSNQPPSRQQESYGHPTQDPNFFNPQRSSSSSGNGRNNIRGPPRTHAARSHERTAEYERDLISSYESLARLENKSSSSSGQEGLQRQQGPQGGVPEELIMDTVSMDAIDGLDPQWLVGPQEAKGRRIDFCDRPILCSSLLDGECVLGSSNHSLYCFDVYSGKRTRELFTKQFGHKEWVTCVTHARSSGHIVSGCAEGKICLWNPKGVRCIDFVGHTSSISTLLANDAASLVCSGSYDGSIRFWSHQGQEISRLQAHEGGVLGAAWLDGTLVSGGRDGLACVWDMRTGKRRSLLKGHKGHITAVAALFGGSVSAQSCMFATGAQDGCVRVWDTRARKAVANVPAHVSASGSGAVGQIAHATDQRSLVSYGADGNVAVLDMRQNFRVGRKLTEQRDFIYSMALADHLVLTGAGDGMLLAHDLRTGEVCWGLGANKAAVRCIEVLPGSLVAAGDDGNAITYDFC